jgi:hypothetical protein
LIVLLPDSVLLSFQTVEEMKKEAEAELCVSDAFSSSPILIYKKKKLFLT